MIIESVSVSEFSVLLTLVAPDSGALTIAFWDLQTEEVTYHHIDGHSLPVEGDGKDELCLFLTGKRLIFLNIYLCSLKKNHFYHILFQAIRVNSLF